MRFRLLPKGVAPTFQFKIKGVFAGFLTVDLAILGGSDPVVELLATEKMGIA